MKARLAFESSAAVRTLKDLVRSRELGTLRHLGGLGRNLGLFQRNLGAIWDLAPHDTSILLRVLGLEPITVGARAQTDDGLLLASDTYGPSMTMDGAGHGLLTIHANHDQSANQLLPPLMMEEDGVAKVLVTLDRMLTWLGRVEVGGQASRTGARGRAVARVREPAADRSE